MWAWVCPVKVVGGLTSLAVKKPRQPGIALLPANANCPWQQSFTALWVLAPMLRGCAACHGFRPAQVAAVRPSIVACKASHSCGRLPPFAFRFVTLYYTSLSFHYSRVSFAPPATASVSTPLFVRLALLSPSGLHLVLLRRRLAALQLRACALRPTVGRSGEHTSAFPAIRPAVMVFVCPQLPLYYSVLFID